MAEIKIEKKTSYWPWVLLAILLIAALIYFFGFRNNDDDTDTVATADTTATVPAGNLAVNDFVEFVNAGHTMGLDHEYTNGAFTRLIAAINDKAAEIGYDVKADIDKVKEHADHITQDPFETSHANSIQSAAEILATSMQNMQRSKFPGLQNQADEVMSAAKNINPKELTLDQRDAVKSYFSKAAELLQGMNQ